MASEWIAQISYHEKGFWQGDLFWGEYSEEPESFFTLTTKGSKEEAIARAKEKWPLAEIRVVEDDDDIADEETYDHSPTNPAHGGKIWK